MLLYIEGKSFLGRANNSLRIMLRGLQKPPAAGMKGLQYRPSRKKIDLKNHVA